MYTGLNEVFGADGMVTILRDFFDQKRAANEVVELLDGGAVYEAFQRFVLEHGEALARAWVAYVRDRFPLAPIGFFWVGKFANGPRRHRPGPSPRLWACHDPFNPDRRRRGNLW